jgi:predicted alpha/beta hydrolase family esterase
MSLKQPKRAIIIPGNGLDEDDDMNEIMWYGWLAEQLRSKFHLEVPLQTFPDGLYAHEHIWKSFAVDKLGLNDETIVIGHSSGSACALRLMEEHKMAGCILVSAYDSDLGDEVERESGYFNRPFNYEKMKTNTPWIIQFHSKNDHLVPVACARRVAQGIFGAGFIAGEQTSQGGYIESERSGHFQFDSAEWLIEALKKQLVLSKLAE